MDRNEAERGESMDIPRADVNRRETIPKETHAAG